LRLKVGHFFAAPGFLCDLCADMNFTIKTMPMKFFIKLLFASAALTAAFTSCDKEEPRPGDPETLTLEANKLVINNDGVDKAILTVRYGIEDVSAEATFEVDGLALDSEKGNEFTAAETGKYKIVAKYNGLTSNEITVEAKDLVNALVLTADKDIIEPDGEDTVHFTVTQGGMDVTSRVSICATEESGGVCLEKPEFSITAPGTFVFYAYFTDDMANPDHLVSNEVEITAIEIEDTGERYPKNVAFFNFTATWCGPCYRYKSTLKTLEADYGDRLVTVCLYSDSDDGHDGSDAKVTTEITGMFRRDIDRDGRRTGNWVWPTCIADLDSEFAQPARIPSEEEARGAFAKYSAEPAATGIKVNSGIDGSKVNVSVEVAAAVTGRYYIGALLLEDNVVCPQFPGGTDGYIDDYSHTDVLRDKAMGSVYGDDLGVIVGGETQTKNINFSLDSKYVSQNLEVVIYTLSAKNGHRSIDNVVKLPANGSI
jgi:thiol-disulfide isomerase/thioredoxin